MICVITPVRKQDTRTVCDKCGAAMVIERVWPIDDETEIHLFRCEICRVTEFFRSKPQPRGS